MRRFLLVAVVLLAGCGGDGGDGGAPAAAETVRLSAVDFRFEPANVDVGAGGSTTFSLTNDGGSPHALVVEGNGIEERTTTISPGESASVTVDLKPGTYELYCPVGNHRALGMEGTLTVGGGAATTGGTGTDGTGTGEGYGYGG